MFKEQPLVTIITITFNIIEAERKKFLQQCIESVHNQTYKNVEHIIVDGGSTDGTLAILEKYKKKKWIDYISEKDKGRYDAMNKGAKLAHGKYISFLNSDDYYHNANGIKKSIDILLKTAADFSYAPVINLDELSGKKQILVPDLTKVFCDITPNHQTILYKKSSFNAARGYKLTYKCLADYDLTLRLCLRGLKSVFINLPFVTYRLGGYSKLAYKDGSITKELTQIYYENYSRLCKLSKNDCRAIVGEVFNGKLYNIPLKLAKKLKNNIYFKYGDYLMSIKTLRKEDRLKLTNTEKKIIVTLRRLKHILIPESSARKRFFERIKSYFELFL